MPGFNIHIGKECGESGQEIVSPELIRGGHYQLRRFTLDKFLDDKIFFSNESYVVVLEGVVLNKQDLNPSTMDWTEFVINLYEREGDEFFRVFRGSFSGALYDIKADKWIVFTDHIGSHHVYYTDSVHGLFFSSHISDVYQYLREKNIHYSLDQTAAYMVLTHGFMLEDTTLCDRIRKLLPGHYVIVSGGKLVLKEYYRLDNTPDYSLSEKDCIDRIDDLFRKSIRLQFNKDREYNYAHLVALSGGLDSRMTSWVAHEMGYSQQINYTFSQSNYLDETIPQAIARDLKHEWFFKALDNGLFLYDLEEVTNITGGNVLYCGLAHENSFFKYFNCARTGIVHSGMLGDPVLGASYSGLGLNEGYKVIDGAYSRTLADRVNYKLKLSYQNQEIYKFYQRGFSGCNNSLVLTQSFSESMSPFYDVEFMEFALSIPLKYRYNHYIYKKWILDRYPGAANYAWEKIKGKITDRTIKIKGHSYTFNELKSGVIRKLKQQSSYDTFRHMNPYAYYFRTNEQLASFVDCFYREHIGLIKDTDLLRDMESLFSKGTAIEKIQVLTLLSAVKTFFTEE